MKVGQFKNVNISVTRGQDKDIDSSNITVTFKSGGFTKVVTGHINNRTNWVHLTAEDYKQEKELQHWGIDLDEVVELIESMEGDIENM